MTYLGMHPATGLAMSGIDHVRRCVIDILTTPLGSRVMRRDYGSLLPRLVDAPGNDATRLKIRAACVMALARWEPRIRVDRVDVDAAVDGRGLVSLDAMLLDGGTAMRIEVPL